MSLERGAESSCSRRRVTDTGGANGSVLVWSLLFTVITSGMIISHAMYLAAHRREMHVRFEHQTLASEFARAGLTDALVWFQKQPNQPVAAFAPHCTPTSDPPLLETLDPTVGLVREFEVHGNLWARYEVRNGEAFDISAERGIEQSGSVWDLGARAYLYQKDEVSAAFDEAPNRVIATDYLRTEMRGIPVLPPAVAALSIDDPTRLDVGPMGHILGGGAPAVAYPAPPPPASPLSLGSLLPALPLPILSALVSGMPASLPQLAYAADTTDVFSMQMDQIKSLADFVFEAGDDAAAGATAMGTGGDGNGAPLLFPQGQGQSGDSGSANGNSGHHAGGGNSGQGIGNQGTTTTASIVPTSLVSWVASVVQMVGVSATTEATPVVQPLSTALSAVGTTATNALGWASAGRAKLAAGAGQSALRIAPRMLRGRAVYIDGDLVLDATTPLRGRILLVVKGNLTVHDGNVSDLQGMIYVAGDAVIDGDFHLEGTMVMRGQLKLGYGTQPTRIQFNQSAIDMLKKDLERYRVSRSFRPGWTR